MQIETSEPIVADIQKVKVYTMTKEEIDNATVIFNKKQLTGFKIKYILYGMIAATAYFGVMALFSVLSGITSF